MNVLPFYKGMKIKYIENSAFIQVVGNAAPGTTKKQFKKNFIVKKFLKS